MFETTETFKTYTCDIRDSHCSICNSRFTFEIFRWNICKIHLKHMKRTVTTCAYLLAALQWRLVDAELEVAHGQQADGSRPRREVRRSTTWGARHGHERAAQAWGVGGAWREAWARVRAQGVGARGVEATMSVRSEKRTDARRWLSGRVNFGSPSISVECLLDALVLSLSYFNISVKSNAVPSLT
jgi:hypothetical protein